MFNKYFIVLILSVFAFQFSSAQLNIKHIDNSKAEKFEKLSDNGTSSIKLENGLTIYLSEDHNQKDILGAVIVRGGAKLDPADATGTAHYFEHMMFKGSTSLGTVNYKAEKVYLDSIRDQYELLRLDRDNESFRKAILKNIDRLSLKAAKYAIPNEFSKVMSSIGGTGVNAFTSYENIVYHNSFPRQSLEQWVDIYVDRFSNPVFRLFQSELETVYEEKNRSKDNMIRNVFEELYTSFYPKSIYGKQTVLGSNEDLKNPSLMAIEGYFKEHYNANNMALVLIGDFRTNEIIEFLTHKFGKWREGDKAVMPSATEEAFDGRELVKKKLSPIPLGIIGYRTVEKSNKDKIVLDVIAKLLSNNEGTGLLDTLVASQKLMAAEVFADEHYDKGGMFVLFVPKPIIQSLSSGEKLVKQQLDKLKRGEFSNELLAAVKLSMIKAEIYSYESNYQKLFKFIDSYMTETEYDEKIYSAEIESVDKDRILRIANKYFGDNYLALHSKIGFPKHDLLDKPNNTPLDFSDNNNISVLAEKISEMNSEEIEPQFIDFNRDVVTLKIKEHLSLYHVVNPKNNVFSMNIRISMGKVQQPLVEQLAYYLSNTGAGNMSNTNFQRKLQDYGSSVKFYTSNDYFTIGISGFDEHLEKTLSDVNYFMKNFNEDKKINKKMIKESKMEIKFIKKDLNSKIAILNEYALYGKNSTYLKRMTTKEIKKLKYSDLKSLMNTLLATETNIHYVGNKSAEGVSEIILNKLSFAPKMMRGLSPYLRDMKTYSQSRVFILEDDKAIQSHIRISIPSNSLDKNGRDMLKPYNYYFGVGMNSIVFKEVREYRSLAYGAWAYYSVPYRFDKPGYLLAGMSTQADKTNSAINIMDSLINKMPEHKNNVLALKSFLQKSINSEIPSFRQKSYVVQYWRKQGYSSDPRKSAMSLYKKLDIENIIKFHEINISGRRSTTSIVGNSKRFDLDKIKANKVFKEVKLKDIIRF